MHSSEFRTMNGSYYSCDVNGKNCVEVIDASGNIKGSIQETLSQGSIYVGNASNVTSELSVKGDGKILVGNGTTITSVSVSGDATLANTGDLTIAAGAVEDSMIEGLAAGAFIVGTDGTAANNAKVTMSGDATMDGTGDVTIATGAVEDSMIEGLAAGQFIVGTDGTAANNAKVTMIGDATMAGTGAVTIANDAINTAKLKVVERNITIAGGSASGDATNAADVDGIVLGVIPYAACESAILDFSWTPGTGYAQVTLGAPQSAEVPATVSYIVLQA